MIDVFRILLGFFELFPTALQVRFTVSWTNRTSWKSYFLALEHFIDGHFVVKTFYKKAFHGRTFHRSDILIIGQNIDQRKDISQIGLFIDSEYFLQLILHSKMGILATAVAPPPLQPVLAATLEILQPILAGLQPAAQPNLIIKTLYFRLGQEIFVSHRKKMILSMKCLSLKYPNAIFAYKIV